MSNTMDVNKVNATRELPPQDSIQGMIHEIGQHLTWLLLYAEETKASDWRDMRLRSIQQSQYALRTLAALRDALEERG